MKIEGTAADLTSNCDGDSEDNSELFCEAFDTFPPSEDDSVITQLSHGGHVSENFHCDSITSGNTNLAKCHYDDEILSSYTNPSRSSIRSRTRRRSEIVSKSSAGVSVALEKPRLAQQVTSGRKSYEASSFSRDQDTYAEGSHTECRTRGRFVSDRESSLLLCSTNNHTEIPESSVGIIDGHATSALVFFAGLVVKAVTFQISMLTSFITFPVWILHQFLIPLFNPFQFLKSVKHHYCEKFSGAFLKAGLFIYEGLWRQRAVREYVKLFGWGCFWASSICVLLTCSFIVAFITSGIIMSWSAEEPIRLKEALHFDYTKANPVALVPILSCDAVVTNVGVEEKINAWKLARGRLIPPNHKLQVVVSLILPESDHNRRLGVFQVRVDLLSVNGKVKASLIRPCMLPFKSSPVRYMETFLKSGPLLAGYASESQTLLLRMTGLKEGFEPTTCLRVTLEQRAEYSPGTGVPEIYSASLMLESALPFFKGIIWKWKRTIFIWFAMWLFMMELFLLVCCRIIIVPRVRVRDVSVNPHGT